MKPSHTLTATAFICTVFSVMTLPSCTAGAPGAANAVNTPKAIRFFGEAEFVANPSLQGRFDDVLVSWLESASQSQAGGDTGGIGDDRLPIFVPQDETRIFAMDDANGRPNTMQLLDASGSVQAETGAGKPPAVVKLKAGTYTLLIRRAPGIAEDEKVVAVVMPLQRFTNPATKSLSTLAEPNTVTSQTATMPAASNSSPPAPNIGYTVNGQITDAITQANVTVLSGAPAMSMGSLYVSTSPALANAAHNATAAQQQAYVTSPATTTDGVASLYGPDTSATAIGTARIWQ